jgi:hypothetical protein
MGVEIIAGSPATPSGTNTKFYSLYFSASAGVPTMELEGTNYDTTPTFAYVGAGRWSLSGAGILNLRNSVITTCMAHQGAEVMLNIRFASCTDEYFEFVTTNNLGVATDTFDVMYLGVIETIV